MFWFLTLPIVSILTYLLIFILSKHWVLKLNKYPKRIFYIPLLIHPLIFALIFGLFWLGMQKGAIMCWEGCLWVMLFLISAAIILLIILLILSAVWYYCHKKKKVDLGGKIKSEDE